MFGGEVDRVLLETRRWRLGERASRRKREGRGACLGGGGEDDLQRRFERWCSLMAIEPWLDPMRDRGSESAAAAIMRSRWLGEGDSWKRQEDVVLAERRSDNPSQASIGDERGLWGKVESSSCSCGLRLLFMSLPLQYSLWLM